MKATYVILSIAVMMLLAVGTVSAEAGTPSCDFTATVVEVSAPLTTTFTATYDGNITPPVTYEWDFGDDSGAVKLAGNTVSHTYTEPGTYNVRLAVYDVGIPTTWWVSTTKVGFIVVHHPAPDADFDYAFVDNEGQNSPLTIEFLSKTTGYEPVLLWGLGDGTEDTRANFEHTYYNNGDAPKMVHVTLTARNDGGQTSESQSFTINPAIPTANFGAESATTGSVPLAVQFRDESEGAGAMTYEWNFGDGQTSTDKNPLHAYGTIGEYDVSLEVTTPYGSDTKTKEEYVTVTKVVDPEVCPTVTPTPVPTVSPTPVPTGDLQSNVGIYKDGIWYLDHNGNGAWNAGIDNMYSFGAPAWVAITGNWNGDASGEKIGIYKDGVWYLDMNHNGVWNEGTDKMYFFGAPLWTPVKGDWDADGTDEIGVYKDGVWYLDYNGNGIWDAGTDKAYFFGASGWVPVTNQVNIS